MSTTILGGKRRRQNGQQWAINISSGFFKQKKNCILAGVICFNNHQY